MFDDLPTGLRRLSRKLLHAKILPTGSRTLPDAPRNLPEAMRNLPVAMRNLPDAFRNLPGMPDSAFAPRTDRPTSAPDGGIVDVGSFGANPGGLRMQLYVPQPAPRRGAPLLVLLHGCGQDAARFARDAGWFALADTLGAALVLPVQGAENNQGRCFNWFLPDDIRRDAGELASIRQMVAAATDRFSPDPARIFVAGLSAGGAMAAALLAAYPDVFAAGAVFAGMPVGGAGDLRTALALMAGKAPLLSPEPWAGRARAAGPSAWSGRWPRLSVWHGTSDRTVAPGNAGLLVGQWAALHGVGLEPARVETIRPGLRRQVWGNPERPAVEEWTIDGMSHGYPVAAGPVSDPFVLPVGVDATAALTRFWDVPASARSAA